MSDIALVWDSELGAADLDVTSNDFVRDDGLDTAVYLSLFQNRRAENGDVLPEGTTDRGGWWGDAVPVVPEDRIGSRLWLLSREKSTADIPGRAEEYAREALQWLLDDGVSDQVDVQSEIVDTGLLGLVVTIHRPSGDPVEYRYQYAWASQAARSA